MVTSLLFLTGMSISVCWDFNKKVLQGLRQCGLDLEKLSAEKASIGVAVSGGADSVSLLVALCSVLKSYGIFLYAVTVNHFIRPDEETCGDVEFVENLCRDLKKQGYLVECIVHEVKKGEIQKYADENKSGIEEAARHFRYEAFEKYIHTQNLSAFCLAHNKNDRLETAVMRILQGNSSDSVKSIPQIRGKFIRPLLSISRSEIEAYLTENNIGWRTDSTNFDPVYLRNKIRHKLIPLLNEEFTGWEQGILSGIEKGLEDNSVLEHLAEDFKFEKKDSEILINRLEFCKLEPAIQKRVITRAVNAISKIHRISNGFLTDFLQGITASDENKNSFTKRYEDLEFIVKKSEVLIKKAEFNNTDLVFFDIIKTVGNYDFPWGFLEVSEGFEKGFCSVALNGNVLNKQIKLPFCLRNLQPDDEVKTAEGNYKKVADIYKDWQVPESIRETIPIIQDLWGKQEIICIIASIFGYKDWIVK